MNPFPDWSATRRRPLRHAVAPLLSVAGALRENPRAALRLARDFGVHRSAWPRVSLQVNGRACLAAFYRAADAVGVRPFLMWGTLLGHMRERRFIAHDRDIDMGLLVADYGRRDAFLRALRAEGFFLRKQSPFKLSLWWRDTILHLDMDLILPFAGRTVCVSAARRRELSGLWFPAGAFEPLREDVFLGTRVLVPAEPETVLSSIYGDWRVPAPSYRAGAGPLNREAMSPETLRALIAALPSGGTSEPLRPA
jgi:hypothetical protein